MRSCPAAPCLTASASSRSCPRLRRRPWMPCLCRERGGNTTEPLASFLRLERKAADGHVVKHGQAGVPAHQVEHVDVPFVIAHVVDKEVERPALVFVDGLVRTQHRKTPQRRIDDRARAHNERDLERVGQLREQFGRVVGDSGLRRRQAATPTPHARRPPASPSLTLLLTRARARPSRSRPAPAGRSCPTRTSRQIDAGRRRRLYGTVSVSSIALAMPAGDAGCNQPCARPRKLRNRRTPRSHDRRTAEQRLQHRQA